MKRWKKWVLRGVLATIVLPTVSLVADHYWKRHKGESRLAEVRAELHQTDPGWQLDDILAAREAKFPPDNQNIMSLVERIHPRQPDAFKEWNQREVDWLPKPEFNRLPDPTDVEGAKRVRSACLGVIEPARRVRHMILPGGYHLEVKTNVLNTPLEQSQHLRGVVALLWLDALVFALDNDCDRAVESTHAALNAARGIGDEPFYISMLVRLASTAIAAQAAERVLAWGEPRAGLAELQAKFSAEAVEPLLAVALRGERAMFDRVFESVDSGSVGLKELTDDPSSTDLQTEFATWFYRGHLPADRAAMLLTMTAYLDASRRPPHEQPALFAAVSPPPREFDHLLSGLLLPAIQKMAGSDWRVKACLLSAAVGIACERFRQANGRWPKDLAEIPKTILPEVPIDPYDGQPLRFRRTEDGVAVYCVGPDKVDDGGNLAYGTPEPGQDVGFRLWDPKHRRAAPLPKPKAEDEP
jgi:hypothetical protein